MSDEQESQDRKEPTRKEQAREIFMEIIDLSEDQRQSKLDELCNDDALLKLDVEVLLMAHDDADGFMSSPTVSIHSAPITEKAGSIIGPYKLLQQIGEGGFGTVFLAEQSKPIRRRVALKIIKLGMDTRQVIARFEAERQALALMDHPHIARVLDACATDTGRPYFVMEYVVGDPITDFADAHKLSVRERLDLFTQVCSAVQHAHQKGIIHRDIKPSNILVNMTDGKPFAKVIDFGIAKATATPLTEKTLFTEHHQLIGTLEYMSPEQAEGLPDIDTRTDVYALGVLLYELLTGQTPIDGKRLRSAAWNEMRRIIKEEEPPAPSVRLSRDVDRLAAISAARRTEPTKLGAILKGELDWIAIKALDKDRARRYETPNALAEDVKRHLSGEAVVAAPPSRGYRVRKFVRRNKGPVIAGSAVAAALLIGVAGTAWGWREANQANSLLADNIAVARDGLIEIVADTEDLDPDERAMVMESMKISEKEARHEQATAYIAGVRAALDTREELYGEFLSSAKQSDIGLLVFMADWKFKEATRLQDELQTKTDAAEWSSYTANLALAQMAMDNGNWPEARERITACPESKRGWEWEFLDKKSRATQWELPGESGLRLSKDGTRVAAFLSRDSVAIHDTETGETIAEVQVKNVARVALSPDGSLLLITTFLRTGYMVSIWNATTGTKVVDLANNKLSMGFIDASQRSFSSDGKKVAGISLDDQLRIWDSNTGVVLREFDRFSDVFQSAFFIQDGSRIVVNPRIGPPQVLDSQTGEMLVSLDSNSNDINASAFNQDGSLIGTAGRGSNCRIWDSATGQELLSLGVPSRSRVDKMIFSVDSSMVATGSFRNETTDGAIRLWETESGNLIDQFDMPDASLPGGISNDNRSLFVDRGPYYGVDSVRKVDIGELGAETEFKDMRELRSLIVEANLESASGRPIAGPEIVTPDGTRRITANGRSVHFVDIKTNKEVAVVNVHDVITTIQMASDGARLLVTLNNDSLLIWDIRSPEDRRADVQRRWAESVPAGEYLYTLMAGPTPTDGLLDAIKADASLTPLRRLAAAELLDERLDDIGADADRAFDEITKDQTDKAQVLAAAKAADLPTRVKEQVLTMAEAWEYEPPHATAEEKLAEETRQRRLVEAELITDRLLYDESQRLSSKDRSLLVAAFNSRAEILGQDHLETLEASWMLGSMDFVAGDHEKGLPRMRAATKAYEQLVPPTDGYLIAMYENLFQAELQTGQFEAAESWLDKLAHSINTVRVAPEGSISLRFLTQLQWGVLHTSYIPPVIQLPFNRQVSIPEKLMRVESKIREIQRIGLREAALQEDKIGLWTSTRENGRSTLVDCDHDLATRVVTIIPNDHRSQRSFALASYRQGEYETTFNAIKLAAKYRATLPDDPTTAMDESSPHPYDAAILAMSHYQLAQPLPESDPTRAEHLAAANEALAQ